MSLLTTAHGKTKEDLADEMGMRLLGKAFDFLVSVRTTMWLLIALIFLLLCGAAVMPSHEEFLALHTVALFSWLREMPAGITWWLWASLAVLALLAMNTIVCSIDSLFRKRESRQWLLLIAPQVIHIGFLFILLAHVLTSYGSFKAVTFAYRDSVFQLPDGLEVRFNDVRADIDASGFVSDWSADIEYFKDGRSLSKGRIRPNSPSFRDGFGIYVKTVKVAPFPVAMIEVSREPGARWAFAGGMLFMAGMITLLIMKMRTDEIGAAVSRK